MVKKSKSEVKNQSVLKIGEHLVKVGAVTGSDIEAALDEQSSTGCMLGKILQAKGKISAYRFYQEYAKFKSLEFINLDERRVDSNLIKADKRDFYLEYEYIPFEVTELKTKSETKQVTLIATTHDHPKLEDHLNREFGEGNYKFIITSPYDVLWTLQSKFADLDTDIAKNSLHENNPNISSKDVVFSTASKIFCSVFLALLFFMLFKINFLIGFLLVLNLFYFSTILSKVLFFFIGVSSKNEINNHNNSYPLLESSALPNYSILVPLYKERPKTIAKLIKSLRAIDYPSSKLDIKLICESDDFATVETIKEIKAESHFQIIRVPYSEPRTKPKACNYALRYCKGEFVTIYDAEDIPAPDQLKKVVSIFSGSSEQITCVQARLNYYNRNENLLTGLFSIEYASWFDYMLYGLKKLDLPIPLGGTSNHFRVSVLKKLYAWDPYNVTEDADLGIRLAFADFKTEVIDSLTQEESPVSIKSWMSQRSRWIKGYIQTYFVHMKNPIDTYRNLGAKKFFGFTFFVGAPFVVFLTVPIVLAISMVLYMFDVMLPSWLIFLLQLNLYTGIIVHLAISFFVIHQNKWYDNVIPAICFPFYWLLHYIASFRAVYELVKKPHHWNKTDHGVSLYTNTA